LTTNRPEVANSTGIGSRFIQPRSGLRGRPGHFHLDPAPRTKDQAAPRPGPGADPAQIEERGGGRPDRPKRSWSSVRRLSTSSVPPPRPGACRTHLLLGVDTYSSGRKASRSVVRRGSGRSTGASPEFPHRLVHQPASTSPNPPRPGGRIAPRRMFPTRGSRDRAWRGRSRCPARRTRRWRAAFHSCLGEDFLPGTRK
jgi:hypothetical protein